MLHRALIQFCITLISYPNILFKASKYSFPQIFLEPTLPSSWFSLRREEFLGMFSFSIYAWIMFLSLWQLALMPLHKKGSFHMHCALWLFCISQAAWSRKPDLRSWNPVSFTLQKTQPMKKRSQDLSTYPELERLMVKVNSNKWFKPSIFHTQWQYIILMIKYFNSAFQRCC